MDDPKTTQEISGALPAGIVDNRSAPGRLINGLFGGGISRFLVWFVLLFGLGMAVITLVGSQGWLAYRELETEAATLRDEVASLKAQRQELEREMNALREDPGYIELLARQRLGLVKPGERVIQLPPEKKPQP